MWHLVPNVVAYNFRWIGYILTIERLREYLRMLDVLFLAVFELTGAVLRHFGVTGALIPELAGYCEISREYPGIHTGSQTK